MSMKEEGYLHDIIAAGLIGLGIGTAIAGAGVLSGLSELFSYITWTGIDWGRVIAGNLVSGLFGYVPGGFVAGYLVSRLYKAKGRMEGVAAGLIAAIAHLIITLLTTILRSAIAGGISGDVMALWAISFVFALIFYPIGGFLAGMFEGKTIPIPSFLRLQFGAATAPPPPPPAGAAVCPTCGGSLTYVQQYQRWYCHKCQKYA